CSAPTASWSWTRDAWSRRAGTPISCAKGAATVALPNCSLRSRLHNRGKPRELSSVSTRHHLPANGSRQKAPARKIAHRWCRIGAIATASLLRTSAIGCLLPGALLFTSARAQDVGAWPRFPGSAYASQSDASDRAFLKEWEATPPKGYPTLSPANVAPMKAAVRRYGEIVAAGGFPPLPEMQLQLGMVDPAVVVLRHRLILSGDLYERDNSERFDFYVDKAVKRYQASNGLAPTGIVDKRTIIALNVPASSRL